MTKQRGNHEGSIRKRDDGRWEARYTAPDGKRKSLYGKTRQEVAKQLTAILRDQDMGVFVVGERQTMEQFLQVWLETMRYQVRRSSWQRYRNYVRHIVSVLGKVVLAKLTAQQVQMFYTRKLNEGLCSTTVQTLHVILHHALRDALRLGLVTRNVTDLVQSPRRRHYEVAALSAEQARAFLAAASGDRLEALYVLALTTGMRRGELLALQWQDVDVERGVLQVRGSVQDTGQGFIIAEPKTKQARRQIGLTEGAVGALRRHRARQEAERHMLGPSWDTTYDLVFPNTIGKLMDPEALIRRSFRSLLQKARLPLIRFHDLRHTAATFLLSQGVNVKVVSEMLGHADISTTLRVYAHVTPHMQQVAVQVMETLLENEDDG